MQIGITEAQNNNAAGAAVCAVCLPGDCAELQPWLDATLQAGFTDVYLYFASGLGDAAGVAGPVLPMAQPSVHWLEADIPAASMPDVRPLLLTDCVHRLRSSHPFVAMAEPGSFLSREVRCLPEICLAAPARCC